MKIFDNLSSDQLICVLEGQSHNWKGYIAIDSLINGKSTGGVMMLPDVTLVELMHIARTMTLKYGFLGIPRGGAKGAIIAENQKNPDSKNMILSEFGKKLAPLIQNRIYEPGSDMGVGPQDLQVIQNSGGFKRGRRMGPISHSRSGYFTSFTVFAATRAAVETLRLKLDNCTAAIEGFGNVGNSLASIYNTYGVKVVAISTIDGALYNSKGLDIPKLISLYRKHGSRAINYGEGEILNKDELLNLNVDILAPCARAWSITENNVDQIQAKLIVPAANCAVIPVAEEILFRKNVLSVPHFVASCGGALGSTMEFLGCTEVQIWDFIQKEVKQKIINLLTIAGKTNQLPLALAAAEANTKFRIMQNSRQNGWKSNMVRIGMSAYRSGILPVRFTRRLLPNYLKKMLWADSKLCDNMPK